MTTVDTQYMIKKAAVVHQLHEHFCERATDTTSVNTIILILQCSWVKTTVADNATCLLNLFQSTLQ